jgi:hypothetical protein
LSDVRTGGEDKGLSVSKLVMKNNRFSRIRVCVEEHTLSGVRNGFEETD